MKKSNPARLNHLILLCCLLFFFSGCLTTKGPEKWKPLKKKPVALGHTVQWPGETLPIVAAWYTGTEANWKKVANGNPNIVPAHLHIGDRIFIDPSLLQTRNKMPQTFVTANSAPPKQEMPLPPPEPAPIVKPKPHSAPMVLRPRLHKKKAVSPPVPEEPTIELFGPK